MRIDFVIREAGECQTPEAEPLLEYNATLTLTGCPTEFPEQEVEVEAVTERSRDAVEALEALGRKIDARIADHEACIRALRQGRWLVMAEHDRRRAEKRPRWTGD